MKRAFDILASGLAIILLSPLLLPIMILLRLTGEGKIFYAQERVGLNQHRFRILKFATMLENSPNLPGGDITVDRDPRILPMGRIMRDTKINELPQLINIIRGDMSIIGPRPHTSRNAALFPPEYWRGISGLRPGLSGIGSIVFRDEEGLLRNAADRQAIYKDVIVPYKVALETWYGKHASLALDIKLICYTIRAVLSSGMKIEDHLPGLPAPSPDILRLRAIAAG
jgi:lipopolysaccharide/colanic/teichoic acid biosynthesis glycosyltransferase